VISPLEQIKDKTPMKFWKTTLCLTALCFVTAGCESEGTFTGEKDAAVEDAGQNATGDTEVAEDAAPEPDLAVEDTAPADCESDEACGEGKVCVRMPSVTHETLLAGTNEAIGQCVLYPSGPYGLEKNDIVANLSFFDPFTERWVFLHEFYNNPSVKMLVLASGAGWCPPCQAEAEDMVGYFNEHGPAMQVIYGLFEDAGSQDAPPHKFYSTPGDHEKVLAFMNEWKSAFGVNYTLVADPLSYTENCKGLQCDAQGENCTKVDSEPPCDVLHNYYESGGIPFSMIVTTKDMRIRFLDHGYSKMQVEYNILKYVYND
jgi:hypothetical protein